jgi:hypothetical protein
MEIGQTHPTRERTQDRFFRRIPVAVWVLAVLAALFHLAPLWRAQSSTPPDWVFTGNLSISPDYMQYRTWSRSSQETGILVDNRFTAEPNEPYLPVVLYWGIGQISQLLDVQPEIVYEYLGAVLAFFLVLLLFLCVRLFLPDRYQTWWVFLIVLLGGGLTAYPSLLRRLGLVGDSWLVHTLLRGYDGSFTFFAMRFVYPFKILLDTHFLFVWLWLLGALLLLYAVLDRPSAFRYGALVFASAAATFVHVYEGVLLLIVGTVITGMWWVKTHRTSNCVAAWAASSGAALVTVLLIRVLYQSSGLPYPAWRAPDVLFANFVLAYPIPLGLLAWGVARYWRGAGLAQVFLLGWVLGCTAMLLSSPYYPYADRGATTLHVALYLAAGQIFFSRWSRVSWRQAILVILVVGAFPVSTLSDKWMRAAKFTPTAAWTWLDPAHQETLATLKRAAGREDILLADYFDYRWLAPENPGRSYHAHFFLTANFQTKRERVDVFFKADPDEQWRFLEGEGIRFVFVNADNEPDRFRQIEGLEPISEGAHGTLFEVIGRQASDMDTEG